MLLTRKTLQIGASASLIALIFLGLAWETALAPLRPGGSLLVLKVTPLLLPLLGILRGRIYTYRWSSMLILLYFVEGIVRSWTDRGTAQRLALVETALSVIFFLSAIWWVRTVVRGTIKTQESVQLRQRN
jgi:uncharacterized membrane protein